MFWWVRESLAGVWFGACECWCLCIMLCLGWFDWWFGFRLLVYGVVGFDCCCFVWLCWFYARLFGLWVYWLDV